MALNLKPWGNWTLHEYVRLFSLSFHTLHYLTWPSFGYRSSNTISEVMNNRLYIGSQQQLNSFHRLQNHWTLQQIATSFSNKYRKGNPWLRWEWEVSMLWFLKWFLRQLWCDNKTSSWQLNVLDPSLSVCSQPHGLKYTCAVYIYSSVWGQFCRLPSYPIQR